MKRERSSISTTSAIIITLVVAIAAFAAGSRAQTYGVLNGSFSSSDTSTSEGLPDDLTYEEVEQLYDVLRRTYDGNLTEDELLDGLKKGLAKASGDPYTEYLNGDEAKTFTDDLNGTFTGIGAEIGIENEVLVIIAPLKGFPAEQAGIRAGDLVIKINDEETFGMSVEEAVQKIRGEKGTDVTLTVLRDGQQQEITITRDEIKVPSVEWEITEDNIGILEISRFAEDTKDLVNQAADEFVAAGVSGIVLDLRNNSGGFLSAAVDVASLWLDGSVVVEQRENGGSLITESLRAGTGAKLEGIETVVLINQGSASASEIVAGALQDYEVAQLVGVTSFGKGSVQSLERLQDGGVLKVTIARWYTPDGNNIDEEGVKPNIEVEISSEDIDADRDPQRDRALEVLRQS